MQRFIGANVNSKNYFHKYPCKANDFSTSVIFGWLEFQVLASWHDSSSKHNHEYKNAEHEHHVVLGALKLAFSSIVPIYILSHRELQN